ncbi:hypothetical protein WBP06_01450 [Novosphingobium sp. BL-8H]|uniref:hypothetical protein n=1 Tax=Novosphingobium sp. BL-8H TaxID=3127640 RepID=UPI0037574619
MGNLNQDPRSDDFATLARLEARRMVNAVAQAADETPVSMPAQQFRKLAALIDGLSERLEQCDCVEGRLGDPRYWVPLQSFEDLRKRYDRISWMISSNTHDFLEFQTSTA